MVTTALYAASMEMEWLTRRKSTDQIGKKLRLPIYISTNPIHINPQQLRELYTTCNHSPHRLPRLDHYGKTVLAEEVDLNKLQIALSHSSVLVSVFCENDDVIANEFETGKEEKMDNNRRVLDLVQGLMIPLVSPTNGRLVGFGRAVSDLGLTASIYDVMVFPSVRRMGIGSTIVQRIVRKLLSKEVYDIAAVCSEKERLFFKTCGFGDDKMGSTTMMYTRSASSSFPNILRSD